ncbi:MAG: hypothetical protein OXD32_08190, partial [Endozoicomonadaceae bacterium]|nr:hypothetical protein [Endozoicomonadaceae bacterium]
NKNIPTIFNDIKDNIPDAYTVSLTDWKAINAIAQLKFQGKDDEVTEINETNYPENDLAQLTDAATKLIGKDKAPTFMFLHYYEPDYAGHHSDFLSDPYAYITAIKSVFNQVEHLLEAVDSRRENKQEQWLVMIVTDRGGMGIDHFGQSVKERQIFTTFYDPQDNRYSGGGEINALQGQTMITPTILQYFGIPIPNVITGRPINASNLKEDLFYVSYNDNVSIIGNVVGYPQLASTHWKNLDLGDSVKKLTAMVESNDGKELYFFLNDGNYISYDTQGETTSSPKPTASDWESLGDSAKSVFSATLSPKKTTGGSVSSDKR